MLFIGAGRNKMDWMNKPETEVDIELESGKQ